MFAQTLVLQDLGMGTYTVPTVRKNFVGLTAAALSGTGYASTGVALAQTPTQADQLAAGGTAVLLDRVAVDLAAAGYARNGCVILPLAASTPQTVDLKLLTGSAVSAGDRAFDLVYEVVFTNLGATDVAVTPGGSQPWAGPLGGTAPQFTVAAGSQERWHSAAGWSVTAAARKLTFTPGASPGLIAVCFGGTSG